MPDTDSVSYCVAGQEGIIHDQTAGRLLVLNGSARLVWELAGAGRDVAAIAAALCEAYAGVDPGGAKKDVLTCLAELRRLGLAIPPIPGEPDDLGQH
jgi:hypothetical protein